jgi:DNA-binding transcriptional MerR regulator
MSEQGFRTGLVSKLVGLSYKQIDHYDRAGFVRPDIRKAAGRGSRRLYSRTNLIELLVIRRLLERGLFLWDIRRALAEVRRRYPKVERPLNELKFRTDGSTIYIDEPGSGTPVDLLHPEQPVIPGAVKDAAKEIDRAISEYESHRIEQLKVKGRTYLIEIVNDTESRGMIARCPDLLGISTKGGSLEEALARIRERIVEALDKMSGKRQPEV